MSAEIDNRDTIIGALTHDVIEDTDPTIKEVQELFGETVSTYVSWMSEDKKKSWEERKLNAIWHINAMPLNTKWIKLADKVSSLDMISYYVDYQKNLRLMLKHLHQ